MKTPSQNFSDAHEIPTDPRPENFWRSLDELANTQNFQNALHREFPPGASELNDELSRRNFLKIMGASIALAGTTACRNPVQKIIPYVRQPENTIPGVPLFYASSFCLNGFATGVLVESHEGRPTKIEGNPDHPASLGSTDIFAQASILTLYDPDRAKTVLQNGKPSDWTAFEKNLPQLLASTKNGAGVRILTQTITSPTLAAQLNDLTKKFPGARWHQWEAINCDDCRSGAQMAFGKFLHTRYHFDKADVVLALDGDFFSEPPGGVRYARDFMSRRRVRNPGDTMNRLYSVECTPTLVGAMADHRLAVRASEIERFAWALLAELKAGRVTARPADRWTKWISALAKDLQKSRGRSVIYPGRFQTPYVHALAHLLNDALGNVGHTLEYTEPIEARAEIQTDSLRQLVEEMQAGKVDLLLILEGNPVYTAPADFDFASALKKVKHAIHFGLYENETAALCEWNLPAAHYLESWSDARAFDGTISLVQPLIAPLYGGKTAHEILAQLENALAQKTMLVFTAHDILVQHWKEKHSGSDFESWWENTLRVGVMAGTEAKPVQTKATTESILNRLARNTELENAQPPTNLEVIFRADPTIRDGEFSNNGWLQELPKPLTQLTWDNPMFLSPRTAAKFRLSNGDMVELSSENTEKPSPEKRAASFVTQKILTPIWIVPGHADDCATVTLGYGRRLAGRVGNNYGFNFYPLRNSTALWRNDNLQFHKMGGTYPLACTQNDQTMQGRDLVRVRDLSDFQERPDFTKRKEDERISLFPTFAYDQNAWGMSIDLNSCIGCTACTIACQSENNIPVVGKEQVMRGRKMHWIRVDRYFSGNPNAPSIYHEPIPCMQCENAPCELVCPVAATAHSSEGLNDMTYNRCIGTRYCSNNCPYKVRRFNFLQYADQKTESYKLMWNPDVTVRARGVMEKCTYCVQRINAARITAKKENRQVRDGEIVTACQAVCPTQAIVFGNINDANSKVSKEKSSPLNYGLLVELNTRPRTTYLARVRNPNPEIFMIEKDEG